MVNGVSEHSYLMPVTQLRETHSFENIHQGLISSILPQYAQAGATHTYCAQYAHVQSVHCTHIHKNEPENLDWVLGKDTAWELAFQRQKQLGQKKCQQGAGRELTILARKTQHESGRGGGKTKTSSMI